MRTWIQRGLCFFMTIVLLAGAACATDYSPDKVHQPVSFAGMTFAPFDETAVTAALDELASLCGPDCRTDDLPEARRLYKSILTEYEHLDTLYSLAYIHYYASGTAQEWLDAEAELSDQTTRLHDRIFTVLRQLAKSPCRGVLDEDLGEDYTDALGRYEEMSSAMSRLLQEENQLVQRYDQTLSLGVEATVDGQVWTDESLANSDLSATDYWLVSDRLDEVLNEAVGETFRQLVQVRSAIAEEAGYDNYIDYAYASYGRDYTPKDVQRLRQAVKRFFVPLDGIRYSAYDDEALDSVFQSMGLEGETLMKAIQPGISAIHPDLQTSFDFMMRHQLYDTDLRPGKLDGGFTIGLGYYGSAYIFNNPYGTYQDCSDMVHEFGHFHQSFCDPTPALWLSSNMDTAEIHSQALQLLFASTTDLFGSASGDFFFSILSELVSSIQEGCMYDEFLAEVYNDPDLSLDEINRLFKDISEEYGYYYPDNQDESWFWVRVPHNFQAPFYYISYAVSALSSLDLWLRSLEDWDGAVDTYMNLAALSLDVPFRAALDEVGLADIFDRAVAREIADEVENVFLGEEVRYQPPSGPSLRSAVLRVLYIAGFSLISAAVIFVVLAGGVIIVFTVRRRKRRCQNLHEENR